MRDPEEVVKWGLELDSKGLTKEERKKEIANFMREDSLRFPRDREWFEKLAQEIPEEVINFMLDREHSLSLDGKIAGENIAKLREARGLNQTELGDAMGWSLSTIQRIESGTRKLSEREAHRFAEHFNTTAEYITGETEIADPFEYQHYCKEVAAERLKDYDAKNMEWLQRVLELFEQCGYQYEYCPIEWELGGEIAYWPKVAGPHKLINPAGLHDPVYLSDEDLERIQKRLYYAVLAECQCILDERAEANGDS